MHWLWLCYCFHSGLPLFHAHCRSCSRFRRPHLCRPEGLQRQMACPGWCPVRGNGDRSLHCAGCSSVNHTRQLWCPPQQGWSAKLPRHSIHHHRARLRRLSPQQKQLPSLGLVLPDYETGTDNCKKIIRKEGRYRAGRFYPEIIILNVLLYSLSNFSMKQCIAKYIFPFSQKRGSYYADGLCNLLLSLPNILRISLHVKNSDLHHHF